MSVEAETRTARPVASEIEAAHAQLSQREVELGAGHRRTLQEQQDEQMRGDSSTVIHVNMGPGGFTIPQLQIACLAFGSLIHQYTYRCIYLVAFCLVDGILWMCLP